VKSFIGHVCKDAQQVH